MRRQRLVDVVVDAVVEVAGARRRSARDSCSQPGRRADAVQALPVGPLRPQALGRVAVELGLVILDEIGAARSAGQAAARAAPSASRSRRGRRLRRRPPSRDRRRPERAEEARNSAPTSSLAWRPSSSATISWIVWPRASRPRTSSAIARARRCRAGRPGSRTRRPARASALGAASPPAAPAPSRSSSSSCDGAPTRSGRARRPLASRRISPPAVAALGAILPRRARWPPPRCAPRQGPCPGRRAFFFFFFPAAVLRRRLARHSAPSYRHGGRILEGFVIQREQLRRLAWLGTVGRNRCRR